MAFGTVPAFTRFHRRLKRALETPTR